MSFLKLSSFPMGQGVTELSKMAASTNPSSLAWLSNYKRSPPQPPLSSKRQKKRGGVQIKF